MEVKMVSKKRLFDREQAGLPEEEKAELALRSLSEAAATEPKNLLILNEAQTTLPNLGAKLKLYKVLNTETGKSQRIVLDAKNAVVDHDELMSKERALEYDKYGRMQVELHRLVEMGEERTIPVVIKYAVPEEHIDKSTIDSDEALKKMERQALDLGKNVEEKASNLFREMMRQFKLQMPDELSQSGPFISAELPPDVIRDLSKDKRVSFIGLDREKEILDYPTIPESLPTTLTNFIQNLGVKGAGVKIAVLEGGTLWKSASCFNIGATQDTTAAASSHMTMSVAIIGNRYSGGANPCAGNWEGYAPKATVLLANDPTDYKERYKWAKNQGVNVVTMSWHYTSEETSGGLHSRDIYFDYMATHYPWPTLFTSAGNQGDIDPPAYASGKGYNFFGVADVLNDGDGYRCNDVISVSSSWKNPTSPHGDREVPEIAAPGSRHKLLDSSFGGTSCATPVATSIATLLMDKYPALKIWPEAIRAILLATANYQNADIANWSPYSDGKDGTGLINTKYAYLTAGLRETTETPRFRAHDYGTMRVSDFQSGFFNKTWKVQASTTGSRIRVALTWNSKTTSTQDEPTSSELDADLDLWVYDPDMNLVVQSSSWDNNYEFVEFTPAKPGVYTICIRGYKVPNDFWSYYGIAWTTHYDLCRRRWGEGAISIEQAYGIARLYWVPE